MRWSLMLTAADGLVRSKGNAGDVDPGTEPAMRRAGAHAHCAHVERRAGDAVRYVRADGLRVQDRDAPHWHPGYSAAYFEVLGTMPELRAAFALGDHIGVAGRAVAIEVNTDADAAARLAAADRTALRENW